MADNDHGNREMTRDEICAALTEKIRAAWPGDLPAELERSLSVASNDDLRKYLALAQGLADVGVADPTVWIEPEASQVPAYRPGTIYERTGNELPKHRYILAKDECSGIGYQGPDWCPFNLWSAYEFGAAGPNPKLTKQCAERMIFSTGARELWQLIGEHYERPDNVALVLPVRCAEYFDQWEATPKRTPSEHRQFRLELQRKAEQLAKELEHFFDRHFYDLPDDQPNFTLLLSEQEQDEMLERMQCHNHRVRNRALRDAGLRAHDFHDYIAPVDPSKPLSVFNVSKAADDTGSLESLLLTDDDWRPGIVPNLPDMMRRIGQFFAEDAEVAPLQRPNAGNAKRNYFVRRLIQYFTGEKGHLSPTIVARITSMFFEQGITDNEVSQQVGRYPDGRRAKVKFPPKL